MKKDWQKRGLVSLLNLAGFLIMGITGIILYFIPQGRIAYWIDWRFLGLTKAMWSDIHILFSLLFVIIGLFHIYFNWNALVKYFINKVKGGLSLKKELALTTVLSLVIIISAIFHIPPLKYLLDLNAFIKDAWIVSVEYGPPFGHAELLSLEAFTRKTKIDLAKAVNELKAKGYHIENVEKSLVDIARDNHSSSMNIYMIIKKFEAPSVYQKNDKVIEFTAAGIEDTFAGTGIGNKTIQQLCTELKLDPVLHLKRLEKKGIQAQGGERLKQIAERENLTPLDLLKKNPASVMIIQFDRLFCQELEGALFSADAPEQFEKGIGSRYFENFIGQKLTELPRFFHYIGYIHCAAEDLLKHFADHITEQIVVKIDRVCCVMDCACPGRLFRVRFFVQKIVMYAPEQVVDVS